MEAGREPVAEQDHRDKEKTRHGDADKESGQRMRWDRDAEKWACQDMKKRQAEGESESFPSFYSGGWGPRQVL